MSEPLTRYTFTAEDLPDVQSFHCGDELYEKEVSDWIKSSEGDCAVNSIVDPKRPSRVWLYRVGEKIVGFGSLAQSKWYWPGNRTDPEMNLSVIIWVGVQKEFWGKPEGPKEERYSAQILDDLLAEADAVAKTHPILGLYVHKDNGRAIRFYKDSGFNDELIHPIEKETGEVKYLKMFVVLDDEAFEEAAKKAAAAKAAKSNKR